MRVQGTQGRPLLCLLLSSMNSVQKGTAVSEHPTSSGFYLDLRGSSRSLWPDCGLGPLSALSHHPLTLSGDTDSSLLRDEVIHTDCWRIFEERLRHPSMSAFKDSLFSQGSTNVPKPISGRSLCLSRMTGVLLNHHRTYSCEENSLRKGSTAASLTTWGFPGWFMSSHCAPAPIITLRILH